MICMQLDLDLNNLKSRIKKTNAKTLFIQLPEGLKTKVDEIQEKFSGYTLFFSTDPIFGACDLQEHLAKRTNCDLTIHFGHTCFVPNSKKVIYWPTYYVAADDEINDVIKNVERHFNGKTISFAYSIQYLKIVRAIENKLKKNKTVKIILGKTNKRIKNSGQILGCDTTTFATLNKNVDAIIYFGDGYFHPHAFPRNITIYRVYPFKHIEKIERLTNNRDLMLPHIIRGKQRFGIFVSQKIGQSNISIALRLQKVLLKNKKSVYLLAGDNLNNDIIISYNIDVLVNTCCPRIIDDYKNYRAVIVNPKTILETFK